MLLLGKLLPFILIYRHIIIAMIDDFTYFVAVDINTNVDVNV